MAEIIYRLRTRRMLEVIQLMEHGDLSDETVDRFGRLTDTQEAFWEAMRLMFKLRRILERHR